MLTRLDSLSLPGDAAKANEDAFAHADVAAAVFDGATMLGEGLMPGPSDAAWIAQFGARRLLAHLKDGEGPRKALRAALGDTEKSFGALRRHAPEDQWQMPCASMMLAFCRPLRPSQSQGPATATSPARALRARGGGGPGASLEFLWFGDCAGLLERGGKVVVIGEAFAKRAAEAERARAIAKEKNLSPTAGLNRPEFIGALRAARNHVNSGSNWLFSPDRCAAAHVHRRIVAAPAGSHLLLASDGFLALACDYGAYDAAALVAAAKQKGLAALGEELRTIEAADAAGEKFARFKKSDDATALLLKIV